MIHPYPPQPPPADQEIVDVELSMSNGDRYIFPGVQFKILWMMIRNETMDAFPQISLVNHQRSCLTVTTSGLLQVLVNGQPFWTRPASGE